MRLFGRLILVGVRRVVAGCRFVRRLDVDLVVVRDVGLGLLRFFGHGGPLPGRRRRQTAVLIAALALVVGGLESAHGAGQREVKVPNLRGLKRSEAEARLARDGFGYLLPTPRALRYETVTPSDGRTEQAVAEGLAPNREVVAQEPSFGGYGQPGDLIPFATRLPPHAGTKWRYVFRTELARATIWPDDRQLTLHFGALGPRCQAFDHVDVGLARRYVVVQPSIAGTIRSQERCRYGSKRVAHLELPEPVGDRLIVDLVPIHPRHGLHKVERERYVSAEGRPDARAVAVNLFHSLGCGLLARVKVRETRRAVTITTFTGNLSRSKWCDLVGISDMTIVPLKHPLGQRRIVDGARRGR
jgi:hypothetical protein